MNDGPGRMWQRSAILNEHRPVLGNKEQWKLARSSEATACIQSTLPSPLFYESIT